ncbi:MAG TPA: hypothetical protein VGC38_03635 [Pseudolabrys sp.]
MTLWKCAAVFMMLSGMNATSSQAEEAVTGRWAADVSSCEGFGMGAQSPLVVTSYAVRWQGDSCRIGRMYKTGDTIYIQALCWAESGEKSIPVSLHPHAGKLAVTWDRGTRGELQRCP